MNVIVIMTIAFAAPLLVMACITARMRRARRSRDVTDDAAIRELYDRYVTDVKAVTQEYLRNAPSDDEWLARIRELSEVPERPKRARRFPAQRAGRKPGSLARPGLGLAGHLSRLPSLEIPLGVAAASGAAFFLTAHSLSAQDDIGWWWAPISLVAILGTAIGKLIGSGGQECKAGEEDHKRIGTRRQSALITPGPADTQPDGQDRCGRRGRA